MSDMSCTDHKIGSNMRIRTLSASLAAALLIGATAAGAAAASPPPDPQHGPRTDRMFEDYMRAHPGDWEGAVDLVESRGGTVTITGNDGQITTAAEAASASRAMSGQEPVQARAEGESGPLDWPTDAFSTLVAIVDLPDDEFGVDWYQIYGEWDWKDDFIGQGTPVDIAALLINKDCGTWHELRGNTYTWSGVGTSLLSLRSGGIGTPGPIWNVNDYVTNFENQADHGYVLGNYDASACPDNVGDSLQGEMIYEGNDGSGSVLSVSIGWGLLNVTYEAPPTSQQHSSGPASVGESSGDGWSD